MSKYDALAEFLASQDGESIVMSFERINALVIGGLPQSAYDYRPWWANRHDGRDAQNKGWQSVGFETSDVDMDKESVTFNRIVTRRSDFQNGSARTLTIEEAKRGLAASFGVNAEAIEITIRG